MDEATRRKYEFETLCIFLFNRLAFIASHLEELEDEDGMQGYHILTAQKLTKDTIAHAKEVIERYETWKPRAIEPTA